MEWGGGGNLSAASHPGWSPRGAQAGGCAHSGLRAPAELASCLQGQPVAMGEEGYFLLLIEENRPQAHTGAGEGCAHLQQLDVPL